MFHCCTAQDACVVNKENQGPERIQGHTKRMTFLKEAFVSSVAVFSDHRVRYYERKSDQPTPRYINARQRTQVTAFAVVVIVGGGGLGR